MTNLYREVYNLLCDRDTILAERYYSKFSADIELTKGKVDQVAELNHYWRIVFGLMNEDTLKERSCLVDHIPAEVWLDNFKRYVLDSVLKFGLPYGTLDVR